MPQTLSCSINETVIVIKSIFVMPLVMVIIFSFSTAKCVMFVNHDESVFDIAELSVEEWEKIKCRFKCASTLCAHSLCSAKVCDLICFDSRFVLSPRDGEGGQ